MFQWPFLPEILLASYDFKLFYDAFRGKKSAIKRQENFTDDDLLVYKHSFYTWGKFCFNH